MLLDLLVLQEILNKDNFQVQNRGKSLRPINTLFSPIISVDNFHHYSFIQHQALHVPLILTFIKAKIKNT